MKIRLQLVLAFFLLAVVPLAGIVLYSYYSSLRAVRETVRQEAGRLTQDMDERITEIQQDLESGVERLGRWPLMRLLDRPSEAEREELTRLMLSETGKAAPFVQSFEIRRYPAAPAPPPADGSPDPPAGTAPDAPREPSRSPELRMEDFDAIILQIDEELRGEHPKLHEILMDPEDGLVTEGARLGLRIVERIAEVVAEEAEKRLDAETESGEDLESDLEAELREARRIAEPHRVAAERRIQREMRKAMREEETRRRVLWSQSAEVLEGERPVGLIQPRVSAEELLHQVLSRTRRDQGEVPFALDAAGELYTASEEDRELLQDLPLEGPGIHGDWLIVTSAPEEGDERRTGLRFGIARPLREPLVQVRQAAARNFAYGLGLIGLALIGILPLSGRMTRDLHALTDGAEKIATGDLTTRVPVRSRDELGQLARAFNGMAHDLEEQQERLLSEERRRRDQEIEQIRLRGEYERKTRELEEAREFQLSMLPKELPRHPSFEIAVHVRTATEVGGDYYDFHLADDGTLTTAIGDATGHGARAGTMVTVVKSLFSAYASGSGLQRFLVGANRTIRHMDLGRMSMGLQLAELRRGTLTLSSAGMPPALIHRRHGTVEEVALEGMPLGGLEFAYREQRLEVEPGDTILLMTDGLPELLGRDDEIFGYDRSRELFESVAGLDTASEVVDELAAEVNRWTGGESPGDDVTLVVIKVR